MGYLVCDNCKSYYELQPGQSPDDFTDECECGGRLTYSKSLETIEKGFNAPETTTICAYCGTENPEDQKLCKSCKRFLVPIEISRKPDKPLKNYNPNSGGIRETWNNQRITIKVGVGIVAIIFLGLILMMGISGISSLNDKINQPLKNETAPQISDSSHSTSVPGGFIANSNSGKFHVASCKWVGEMTETHKIYYSSREDAIKAGYVPCKVCHP